MPFIAPSILTVPLLKIKKALKEVAGNNNNPDNKLQYADLIHVDVMDGKFVQQTTPFWNIKNVLFVKKNTTLPLITHLMVEHPKSVIKDYAKAGSSYISFHVESKDNINETLKECKKYNVKPGIAVNPETPVEQVFPYLKKIAYVLIMSVHPGKGGQEYMDVATRKIKKLDEIRKKHKFKFLIEVDGGIKEHNVYVPVNAGADIIVSGTGVFNAENKKEVLAKMKEVILLGSDHGGYAFKEKLKKHLEQRSLMYKDIGTYSTESCDYPDYAKKVAKAIAAKKAKRGILICRSGAGMSVAANRYKGIFASLCLNKKMAVQAREHGNSNILCLGADLNTDKQLLEIADSWLDTTFSNEERHKRRIKKIDII